MNTTPITEAHKQQYREEGYFILERAIPPAQLEMLRRETQRFIELIHAEMDKAGTDTIGITHRGKRYFISKRYQESPHLPEFLFGDLMAEICRATIGDTAFLFWEQYVLKGPEVGMKFGWHQDSGYLGFSHQPYVTCWCPLDDVSEANGTVYVLPYSRAGTRERVLHVKEEGTNDMVGYHGDDPGIPVIAPAGSVVVFSSLLFHRSGANTTKNMRRVYLPQYSAGPIIHPETGKANGLGVQFLKNGQRVAP